MEAHVNVEGFHWFLFSDHVIVAKILRKKLEVKALLPILYCFVSSLSLFDLMEEFV
jgi:hypothetical protein